MGVGVGVGVGVVGWAWAWAWRLAEVAGGSADVAAFAAAEVVGSAEVRLGKGNKGAAAAATGTAARTAGGLGLQRAATETTNTRAAPTHVKESGVARGGNQHVLSPRARQ